MTGELVDLHTHVLPGIDDGPETSAEALEMARAAAASGTGTVVATPHLRHDFPAVRAEQLAERCRALQEELHRDEISLGVVPGAEVSMEWALDADEEQLRLASLDQRGADLLIETPENVPLLGRMLGALRDRGFRITLAHPERTVAFQRHPERLEHLVAEGALLQVNADSVLARRRDERGRLAVRLCRQGLAHALASDGHRAQSWRPIVELAAAVEALSEAVGPDRARWLATEGPAAIIGGVPVPAPPPVMIPPRARWLGRR